jgi:hypothetical protein
MTAAKKNLKANAETQKERQKTALELKEQKHDDHMREAKIQ